MNLPLKRTHTCGDLRASHADQEVCLNGWVDSVRDHGGVFFVDLRDRYGVTQVVFKPENQSEIHEQAASLRNQDVIGVRGKVTLRPEGTQNKDRPTGEVDLAATALEIFNRSETPPFDLEDDSDTDINIRLQYRYLDLRRSVMQRRLAFRSQFNQSVRTHLTGRGFLELESPILTKATPEGARDYLVPSRVSPGHFYALPQSPQLFKQLFMVGGYDKYFQIARCFRDEDLRADRQPEFTQIDVEMSFVDEEDVHREIEALMASVFRDCRQMEISLPLRRITYAESMARFGVDKPDLRFGLELKDISGLAEKTEFRVFRDALKAGGVVKTIGVPGGEAFKRKDLDSFTAFVADYGARGVAYIKLDAEGKASGPVAKFAEPILPALRELEPEANLFLFVADQEYVANAALGNLRNHLGDKLGLRDPDRFELCWVTDFPMFEKDPGTGEWVPMHHPFTSVDDWEEIKPGGDLGKINARAYDLVLNGTELGSGSIRIHDQGHQSRIFDLLNISKEEARSRFGFFLDAVSFGAPPHGGFAIGVDRLLQLLLGTDGIREVIAFPKTATAACLMTGAPSTVPAEQLAELRIRSIAPKQDDPKA